jgi:hypothetical protein
LPLAQTDHYARKGIARYRFPLGVGLQNHRHIRHRRPLTESFVLPPITGSTSNASPNCM